MKRLSLALAAALTGVASTAVADVRTFDVKDIVSVGSSIYYDGVGNPSNIFRNLSIPAGSTVTGFGWDVKLEAYVIGTEESWLSEMEVVFGPRSAQGNFILQPASTSDIYSGLELSGGPGIEEFSSNGIISINLLGHTPFTIGPNGLLGMEFAESSDTFSPGNDGKWLSGTLTIEYTPPLGPVPEPGTYGLMALGLLGVVAAAVRRRKV